MALSDFTLQGIEEAKMLAHRFYLKGNTNVFLEDGPLSIELEGFFREIPNKQCYLSFEQFLKTQGSHYNLDTRHMLAHTLDALAFSNQTIDGAQVIERLHSAGEHGGPYSVSIVIYKDTLYMCNRGQGSDGEHGIVEYHIGDSAALTAGLVDQMLSAQGTPYFLQTELLEILSLTETERYAAPPQTVGNCAWTNAIENIHAILLAQYFEQTGDRAQAALLADKLYNEWVNFDLNYALAQLPHFEDDPHQHDMINDVLGKILLAQHDVHDSQQVQRALYILPHVDNPLEHLKNLDDPLFEYEVHQHIQEYTQLYNQSNWLYDRLSYSVNDLLNLVNLGTPPSKSYEEYAQDVHLGKELSELGIMRSDPLNTATTGTLRWEDVFNTGNGMYCHNAATPETPAPLPVIDLIPEYVLGLI